MKFNITIPDSVVLLLKIAAVAGAAYPAAVSFRAMLTANSRAEVIFNGIYLLGSLYFFGLIFSAIMSGIASAGFTDFLLYPRRYLKHPPIILSRPQGLIHRKLYIQAEHELLQMRADNPSSPELTLLIAELHADCMGDTEAAVADCMFYFKNRKFLRHALNLKILFRYAEWMCDCGRLREAVQQLNSDSKRIFYTAAERRQITERKNSLLRQERTEK